jgi:hypothetical protein
MADINQVTTLGIGTPAGIPEFLLFGLQVSPEAALTAEGLEYTLPTNRLHFDLPVNRLHYTMPEED